MATQAGSFNSASAGVGTVLIPVPSPARVAVTCASAIAHAAPGESVLYFALLPATLAQMVDGFVCANAWRWTGSLTHVKGHIMGPELTRERHVTPAGQDVILSCDASISASQVPLPHLRV